MSTGDKAMTPRVEHRSLPHPGRRRHALRAASVTVYATLLLLALAIPGSVVGTLRERPPGPFTNAALAVAEPIQAGLERLGIPAIYATLKERFRGISCGSPESGNPC